MTVDLQLSDKAVAMKRQAAKLLGLNISAFTTRISNKRDAAYCLMLYNKRLRYLYAGKTGRVKSDDYYRVHQSDHVT
jgi:hypothetical protein